MFHIVKKVPESVIESMIHDVFECYHVKPKFELSYDKDSCLCDEDEMKFEFCNSEDYRGYDPLIPHHIMDLALAYIDGYRRGVSQNTSNT